MPPDERQRKALREWIELSEYPGDCRRQYFENYGHRAILGERYRRREGTCHLHVSFEQTLGHGHFHNWCAEFYRGVLDVEAVGQWKARRLQEIEYHIKARLDIDWRNHYWYQQPVLVRVGELTQRPDEWTVERLQSTVWLKPLDDCVVSRINVRKRTAYSRRPVLFVRDDWEQNSSRSLRVRSDRSRSVVQCQLPREMVERGAKVLDRITCDKRDISQNRAEIRDATDVHDVFTGLRIELNPNSYAVLFETEYPRKAGLQRCRVFLRTSDLGPTP